MLRRLLNIYVRVCIRGVGWLDFMAYKSLYVIQCQTHSYTNIQFYFKQFSFELVHGLIVKNICISSYSVYLNRPNSINLV